MKVCFKILAVIFLFSLFACNNTNQTTEIPIAQVYDNYLYNKELFEMIPEGVLKKDSIEQIKKYIDYWINEQLLIEQAKSYLKNDKDEIEKEIIDLRNTLLINKFKETFLSQKLDTVVGLKEINNYYNANKKNYILINNAIKGFYVKIKKNEPDIDILKTWLYSNELGNIKKIRDFVRAKEARFSDFNNDWIFFSNILYEISYKIKNEKTFLKKYKFIEKEDDNYYYFVRILDYKLKGETSPLILNIKKIRSIILNKRSILLIEELERTIKNNAEKKGKIIVNV